MRKFNSHIFFSSLIVFSQLVFSPCRAQESISQSVFSHITHVVSEDMNQVYRLGKGILSAPFNITSANIQKITNTGLITSSLFMTDRSIKEIASDNQSPFSDNLFKIDSYLHKGTGFKLGIALYTSGFLSGAAEIRQMGLHTMESLLIASTITSMLKYTFGRGRPYTGDSQMNFGAFRGAKSDFRSFPSGHTTGAFTLASVMAMSVDNFAWKVAWYTSAGLVGAARIYHNKHWFSDTFLAAVISYHVADYVVNLGKEKNPNSQQYDLSFNLAPGGIGLALSW